MVVVRGRVLYVCVGGKLGFEPFKVVKKANNLSNLGSIGCGRSGVWGGLYTVMMCGGIIYGDDRCRLWVHHV